MHQTAHLLLVGHGAKRCPDPPKEEAANGGFDSGAGGDFGNGGFDAAPSGVEGGWGAESAWAAAPATTTAGGW